MLQWLQGRREQYKENSKYSGKGSKEKNQASGREQARKAGGEERKGSSFNYNKSNNISVT